MIEQKHFDELENSISNPTDRLYTQEFIEGLLKAGSFLSIIEGKKINTVTLLLLILENEKYQDFFTEITASDNFQDSIFTLLKLHPPLVKSKFTRSFVRKSNARKEKHINRSRTTHLQ